LNPVCIFMSYFFNTHLNMQLSTPVSPKLSLYFRFPDQHFECISHL
jgi:hypothetical protein